MRPLHVLGMHGLGDNLHQRAIVRQLMERWEVWLDTPWPCVYHDLVGERLHLLLKSTTLPAQVKNARREQGKFEKAPASRFGRQMRVWYPPETVRRAGSVLGAMCLATGASVARADFRLPVPAAWAAKADALIRVWTPDRPILLYRPLMERAWWGGCVKRNPDHAVYAALFRAICNEFFVVSIGDFEPGVEWIVGEEVPADVVLHRGELDFETLAALTERAALVYTSPGFGTVLAQAVETPSVVVFGGYENSQSFREGAKFAPYLGIDPIRPCQCFSHTHNCDKRVDMPAAAARLVRFVNDHCGVCLAQAA